MNKQRAIIGSLVVAVLLCTFALNVHRNYFLCDDAFISFRYADHLANGEGLVWNPGERVEGYTNFIWVLLMAAGIEAGAAPEVLANVLGIGSGICLLTALLLFSFRAAPKEYPLLWMAPLAMACSSSFTAWCSGGLETMFFTLLVFLAYLRFIHERNAKSARPILSSLLFAIATLTRPEGALFFAVAAAFFLAELLLKRRRPGSAFLWVIPYLAVVGSHAIWRFSYYGYWLPNTFYAKVSGAWWEQGFKYLSQFAAEYQILWFLPLALLALALRPRFANVLFASVTLPYLLYIAYIGGDRLEFRFLVVIFPYLYWLMADGLRRIAAWRRAHALAWLIAVLLLVTTLTFPQRNREPAQPDGVANLPLIKSYTDMRIGEGKFLRGLVDSGLLPADLVLCVGGAGAVPYYTGWPTVDRRGLNDTTIARLPLSERGMVAHEHDAPHEYLLRRKVAMFDLLNRITYTDAALPHLPPAMIHDHRSLPLRRIKAGDRYLVFATFVSPTEFQRIFGKLEIVNRAQIEVN